MCGAFFALSMFFFHFLLSVVHSNFFVFSHIRFACNSSYYTLAYLISKLTKSCYQFQIVQTNVKDLLFNLRRHHDETTQ